MQKISAVTRFTWAPFCKSVYLKCVFVYVQRWDWTILQLCFVDQSVNQSATMWQTWNYGCSTSWKISNITDNNNNNGNIIVVAILTALAMVLSTIRVHLLNGGKRWDERAIKANRFVDMNQKDCCQSFGGIKNFHTIVRDDWHSSIIG